jgi:drug/metabolite transporter (DMT)-like permease
VGGEDTAADRAGAAGAGGDPGAAALDAAAGASEAGAAETAAAPPGDLEAPPRLHLALLVVQLLFSGLHVVGKDVLAEVEPLALACLRAGFAAPALVAFALWRRCPWPAWRDLPVLALLGLLGVAANQVLFIQGLAYTTATNAAILMPSIPVFAAGLGALFGIERIGPRRLAGIGLAIAGALAVLDPTAFSLGDRQTIGNLLVLVNCLAFAAFLVLHRPVMRRLPWPTVIAGSFVFGALFVFAVGTPALLATDFAALSPGTLTGIAYILVFPTLIGYALNTWAVRRSSPTLVAAYTTIQPLASAALAAAFLGETFGWMEGVGFVLIAAGLWVVSRRQVVRMREAVERNERGS